MAHSISPRIFPGSGGFAYDAIVIGSGPNGLAAAITLAQSGYSVLVREAQSTIGGGVRSGELTLPGYQHDLCSAVHPLALSSPFFRELPLKKYGLEWIHPDAPLAHPFDDGPAVILERSIDTTAEQLGADATNYRDLFFPYSMHWDALCPDVLKPLEFPRHPFFLARFGIKAIRSARGLIERNFTHQKARALLAGNAAHSILPLEASPSAAIALMLGTMAHAVGWPIPQGGAQKIADALAAHLRDLGGVIQTDAAVQTLSELPRARAILFDLTPRQILGICGHLFPTRARKALETYRYGPGAFKVDFALTAPIPWRDRRCERAATVHLGGTLEEISLSEQDAWNGVVNERPFVLLAQPSLFDPSRSPSGRHTAWAYCHVPHGCPVDMTQAIENQIERFAPGFRDIVIGRASAGPVALERKNANLVGGDILGGATDLFQLFSRPLARLNPYRLPVPGLYICSASSPPGPGVHGMCGYNAARTVVKDLAGSRASV